MASSSVGTIFSIEAMTICMRGKRRGQVAVALIGDDHRRARLGDQQIGAGDADIGGKEFLAQQRARLGHEILRLVEPPLARQALDACGGNRPRSSLC